VQALNGNSNEQTAAEPVQPEQPCPAITEKHAQPPAQKSTGNAVNINGYAVAAAAVIGMTALFSGEQQQC
jgi:hypothetical protein